MWYSGSCHLLVPVANHASKRPGPATSTPLAGPLVSQACGLRRRASYQRRPPTQRRLGRTARPTFHGGRQLTLYLKVATICPSPGGEWLGSSGCRNPPRRPALVWESCAPSSPQSTGPNGPNGSAIAQKHQGPPTEGAAAGLGTAARGSPRQQYHPVTI